MSRRRRRQTAQVQRWTASLNVVLIGALVLACLLAWIALENPWILLALMAGVIACAGGAGFWWLQRRRHLEQLQAYERLQMQAAQQRSSHQRQLLEAQQRLIEQQRQLGFAQDIGTLLALTPREFELAIGDLLRKLGYQQVRHTGKAGDLAADLHAVSPRGERIIVQCKRFAPGNGVGSGDIQKFIGMQVHHQAQRALFVTTSTFKTPAITLARQHSIELIDGQQLVALFARVNRTP